MSEKLLSACETGDLSAVKEMLDTGIDPSAPGEDGEAPLVLAACSGKAPGDAGNAGVSRRRVELRHRRTLGQAPRDRVLSAAATNDQYFHSGSPGT